MDFKYLSEVPNNLAVLGIPTPNNPIDTRNIPYDIPKWSGNYPIPEIGQTITAKENGGGRLTGIVKSYFVDHGWFGLYVYMTSPIPDWRKRNNPPGTEHYGIAMVMGCDDPQLTMPNGKLDKTKINKGDRIWVMFYGEPVELTVTWINGNGIGVFRGHVLPSTPVFIDKESCLHYYKKRDFLKQTIKEKEKELKELKKEYEQYW